MDATTWARAKDLIGDALELPPAERDSFVAARCPDPALLAEIRSVLRVYADASSFLERPPTAIQAGDDEPDDLPPGHQVGPYVIIDRLARGGMGSGARSTSPATRTATISGPSPRKAVLG